MAAAQAAGRAGAAACWASAQLGRGDLLGCDAGSWPKGQQGCGLEEQAGCGRHCQLKEAEKREEKKTFYFYKT